MKGGAPIELEDSKVADKFGLTGLDLVAHPHGLSTGCITWEVKLGAAPWAVAATTVIAPYALRVGEVVASAVGGGGRVAALHRLGAPVSDTKDSAAKGGTSSSAAVTPVHAWPSSGAMATVDEEGNAATEGVVPERTLRVTIDASNGRQLWVSISGKVDGQELSMVRPQKLVWWSRHKPAVYLAMAGHVLDVRRVPTSVPLPKLELVHIQHEPVPSQHLADGSSAPSFPITVSTDSMESRRRHGYRAGDIGVAALVFAEPRVDEGAIAVIDGCDPYVVHGLHIDEFDTQWLKVEIGEEDQTNRVAGDGSGEAAKPSTAVVHVGATGQSSDVSGLPGSGGKQHNGDAGLATAAPPPPDGARRFGWLPARSMVQRVFMDPLPRRTVAAVVAKVQAGHEPAPLPQQRTQAWRLLTAALQDSALSPMSLRLFGIPLDAKLRAGLISAAVTIASLVANQVAGQL